MTLLAGPDGPIEVLVTGDGKPTTVFAHGVAGSIAETRPFGSGVEGTRVFFHFRGHGVSARPETPWSYAGLAAELMAVRDAYDARRGLGVSLGSGALLHAATEQPDRFDRLVLVLPAAIDSPREGDTLLHVEEMTLAAEGDDTERLTALLLAQQPAGVRERAVVRMWAKLQADRLADPHVRAAMRTIPRIYPLEDRTALARITCPVLVIGQQDDEAHPSRLVSELAEALPDVRSEIFSPGGVVWTHRAALRRLVSEFLNDDPR